MFFSPFGGVFVLLGGVFALSLGVFVLFGSFFVFRAPARFFWELIFDAYNTKTVNSRSDLTHHHHAGFSYATASAGRSMPQAHTWRAP